MEKLGQGWGRGGLKEWVGSHADVRNGSDFGNSKRLRAVSSVSDFMLGWG